MRDELPRFADNRFHDDCDKLSLHDPFSHVVAAESFPVGRHKLISHRLCSSDNGTIFDSLAWKYF
jgi:hypothetical protein